MEHKKKGGKKNLSPRTGRPKSDNPLNHDVKVRFDDNTYEQLQSYCDNHNLKVSELIRYAVVEYLEHHK